MKAVEFCVLKTSGPVMVPEQHYFVWICDEPTVRPSWNVLNGHLEVNDLQKVI